MTATTNSATIPPSPAAPGTNLLPDGLRPGAPCLITLPTDTPVGSDFRLEFSCCPDPFCPCLDMLVECIPMVTPGAAIPPLPDTPLTFALNTEKRQVRRAADNALPATTAGYRIGQAMVKAMTTVDWAGIDNLVDDLKDCSINLENIQRYIDTLPYATVQELLRDHLDDILFTDIFPVCELWLTEFEGEILTVHDSYSLNGDTPPTWVTLTLFGEPVDLPSAEGDDADALTDNEDFPMAVLEVNYETGAHRRARDCPAISDEDLDRLATLLQEDIPDFLLRLDHRHAMLQLAVTLKEKLRLEQEVAAARPAPAAAPRSETAKPGRNAPCPCGSGMKYKKCCGA